MRKQSQTRLRLKMCIRDRVYEANCDGWTAELAAGYVEEALEKYPHVKGIMCGNDDIASQVVQVLAENQLAGNVVVVGQDGDLAACQRIVEGTQYMTCLLYTSRCV